MILSIPMFQTRSLLQKKIFEHVVLNVWELFLHSMSIFSYTVCLLLSNNNLLSHFSGKYTAQHYVRTLPARYIYKICRNHTSYTKLAFFISYFVGTVLNDNIIMYFLHSNYTITIDRE